MYGSVRHWAHEPHVTISQPCSLTPQSSVAVTHYILTAPNFSFFTGELNPGADKLDSGLLVNDSEMSMT